MYCYYLWIPKSKWFLLWTFLSDFEQLLLNIEGFKPTFTVLPGDYNQIHEHGRFRHQHTWRYAFRCSNFNILLANKPTRILPNSSPCIDLIFTNQPGLVINPGTHPPLHANCHHRITYCKLKLKTDYPTPYQRLVWNFKKANITSIRRATHILNWGFLFFNKSVHEQVVDEYIFIVSNYIPNKFVTINDKDSPWMTERTKNKIVEKKIIYKSYVSNCKTVIDYQN